MFMRIKSGMPVASASAVLALSLLTTGCGGGPAAHTTETGGAGTITTVGQIDDQDFAAAARKLSQSMITSVDFGPNADGSKKVIGVSRTKNDTAQMVDTDILLDQIKAPLIESGKATVTTIGGLTTEDPLASRNVQAKDFATGDGSAKLRPADYSLMTHLSQTHATADGVRQNTFYFSMTLTETTNGTVVWTKQVPITKVGSHNAFGG
jgi:uncharacterized protein (TIGR02722 family)